MKNIFKENVNLKTKQTTNNSQGTYKAFIITMLDISSNYETQKEIVKHDVQIMDAFHSYLHSTRLNTWQT